MSISMTDPGRRTLRRDGVLDLPAVLAGRYELREVVASGGMGRVYRGVDTLLDREVAVKVLDHSLSGDDSFVSRFKREARAAARLNHPNVVSLFDYGSDGDVYFIVMEFVDGRSLNDVAANGDRFTPRRAAEIALDVAHALECAHMGGVVHRDITSNNVMVAGSRTKVADFGIAHLSVRDDDHTTAKAGVIVGTAAYLSPEQARGSSVDARSDIYSLGIVLYEMLTGRVPFEGESGLATAYMHILQQVVPPSLLNPEIPGPLETIVMRMLAKDPDDRYMNASDLALDLRRYLAGQDVRTMELVRREPPEVEWTPARATPKPGRRRGALVLFVAPLIAVLGVASGWWLSANWDATTAPRLKNLVEGDALSRIKDGDLDARIIRVHDAKPAGIVIRQTPVAGTNLEQGDTVVLEVSKGPAPTLTERLDDSLQVFEVPEFPGPSEQLWPF
jgi:serine/threonine-protein kinase